uniref:SFRICE_034675 n=1 Tax=Spodoptera frugiperda TaxID=7108 RepID=A0A2H1VYL3_SPOFR
MHAAVINKCNVLWKAAARPKSAEIIQDVLQHTLSRPGETRWNSLFDSLKQIQSIKEKNLLLHRSLNIKNAFKENEFEYIKEYLICAAPVAEALNIMQSETTYIMPLIEAYRQGVENRFKKIFDVTTPEAENATIAALSYPRFKNKWLTCLEPSDRTKILKIFKTCISKQINENETATVATRKANQENIFFNFDADSSYSDTSMTETNSSAAPLTKAELLMLHFFAEESQDLQLLNRYPEIKAVFIRFNTPLPSSALVERLFSFATMTNLPKSHKLSDRIIYD